MATELSRAKRSAGNPSLRSVACREQLGIFPTHISIVDLTVLQNDPARPTGGMTPRVACWVATEGVTFLTFEPGDGALVAARSRDTLFLVEDSMVKLLNPTNGQAASSYDQRSETKPAAVPEALIKDVVKLCKLLADETRMRILYYLTQSHELHVRRSANCWARASRP